MFHVRTTFWRYLWSILVYFWTVARQHGNFFSSGCLNQIGQQNCRIWLEIYSLQTQPLSKSRVQFCFLLSIFREEKVSIDEKHFECRAENDFNTFGTIVTISQSEQDVVFTLGLMAQGSVTFSTDREKYYISFNSSRTAVNDLSASTHKQERPKSWLWVVKNIPLTLIILIIVQISQIATKLKANL